MRKKYLKQFNSKISVLNSYVVVMRDIWSQESICKFFPKPLSWQGTNYHRIIERLGLKEIIKIVLFQPPPSWPRMPHTRPGCPWPHPAWCWILPAVGHPQLDCRTCSSASLELFYPERTGHLTIVVQASLIYLPNHAKWQKKEKGDSMSALSLLQVIQTWACKLGPHSGVLHARGCDYCIQLLEVAGVFHHPAEAVAGPQVCVNDPLGCSHRW